MAHYKHIEGHYITGVGSGNVGVEITAEEYSAILNMIRTKPSAPNGYEYLLKEDLTWEMIELPSEPDPTPEEALNILLGGEE